MVQNSKCRIKYTENVIAKLKIILVGFSSTFAPTSILNDFSRR